jgi:hypothetical protein
MCLWLLLAVALWRAWRGLADASARRTLLGALALLVAAAPLYFRPHEELLGGEDPGAYINAAATFARTGQLRHTDELLAQLPLEQRTNFFYGHELFSRTKDACLWIKDLEKAAVGPWFQPAYSVLLALPLQVLPGWCALFGAPLLALLSALALAAFAVQLFGRRRAGLLALLFFLLLPVVLWNGRSPRAEWGAVLFFWLALALLARAWRAPGGTGRADLALGSLCLCVAPFFHVTAWFGVLPVLVVLLWQAARGRRLFLWALPIATLGALGFVAQFVHITDCYNLLVRIPPWARHPLTILGAAAAVAAVVFVLGRRAQPTPPTGRVARGWALALFVVLLLAGAATWLTRDELGHLPLLPKWCVAYISLTNLKGLGSLVSRFALFAALAGWAAWLWRRGTHADLRLWFAVALLPGLLLTGWMNNYMMESRRMLLFPAPLMALCLTALALWVWERRGRWARPAALALCLALLAVIWRGRTHLATHTDAAGLHRIFVKLAAPIQQANGWLFAEYSQTAAPFEHQFGIPTLALDSDYHAASAPQVEQTWAALLKAHPQRAFFFVTPFAVPQSAMLTFTPVLRETYRGRVLRRELGQLPRQIVDDELTLALYRVGLRTSASVPESFPQTFAPGGSNLGLTGFANQRVETWSVSGWPLTAAATSVPLVGDADARAGDELVLIIAGTLASNTPARIVAGVEGVAETRWLPLGEGWWALQLRGAAVRAAREIQLTGAADAILTDVLVHRTGAFQSLAAGWPADKLRPKKLQPLRARWTLPNASFTLPAPRTTTGSLFLFMIAPDAVGQTMNLRVGAKQSSLAVVTDMPRWYIGRAADLGFTPEQPVVPLVAEPPWRLKIRGFPPELGVLFVRAIATE